MISNDNGGTGTGTGSGQVLVAQFLLSAARNKIHHSGWDRPAWGGFGTPKSQLQRKARPRCCVVQSIHMWCIFSKHPTSLREPLDKWARINSGGSGDQSTLLMPLSRFIIILRGGWCLELGGVRPSRKIMASWKEFRQSNLATHIKSLVQVIVRHGTWQPHSQRLFFRCLSRHDVDRMDPIVTR
jgi:hypothetical protein